MPATPNVPILPPGLERFIPPPPPQFSTGHAWLSALSLLAFAVASILAIVFAVGFLWWAVLPFWFTALGSGVGFLYETWLLLRGAPNQLQGTPRGRLLQVARLGNLAPVFGSVYLGYFLLAYGSSAPAGWLTLLAGLATGYLLVLFTLRGPQHIGLAVLTLGLIAQLVLLFTSADVRGGLPVFLSLTAAAVGLYATTFIGAETPLRSTAFHIVGTVVVALLYFGLSTEFAGTTHTYPIGLWLWLIPAVPLGCLIGFRLLPGTWPVLRTFIANAIWPLFFLVIAGGLRIPRPDRLSKLYAGRENELKPLSLLPYYVAHPRNLRHPVSIPCLDDALTVKVNALGMITQLVKFVFGIGSLINKILPFAQLGTPIAQKPRMDPWSDGTEYWPYWLLKRIYLPRLGWFSIQSGVRGPGLQSTPDRALNFYKRGQLLAFLAEYGAAGAFLEPVVRNGRPAFQLDFCFLEYYETKPDYEPYGGVAFFEIDDAIKSLKLTHVRGPGSHVELAVDPQHATFRHVEDIILASLYFYIVSGKHLVEIHMGLNLVEVALFNAFDAQQQYFHPVRLALYPHLFAHELAEELTTQNLLEDGAIFPQIFATTNAALVRHLNDRFSEYQLGRDEDFAERERVLLSGHGQAKLEDVLPQSALIWEKEYAAVWQEYADSLMAAAFASDDAVRDDACVQVLFANLTAVFQQPLPARYAQLQTRAGLARFIADTMHHLIIRHEIYGTSAVRLALDPRISKVQVPKDGGTYAIDEWRSLACVAMATSRVRYTLLLETDWSNLFDDLKDEAVKTRYKVALSVLRERLTTMQERWGNDVQNNYDTLRLAPDELDLGAGY